MRAALQYWRAESPISLHWQWLPIVVGLALLYVPTYTDLSAALWATQQNTQTPVLLLVWAYLVWRERTVFLEPHTRPAWTVVGWLLILFAGLLYAIGRSQEFFQLEVGSQLPLVAGTMLILLGPHAVRRLWFSFLFLFLIIPVPGSLLNEILVPLKMLVSTIVSQLLAMGGLPIARDGVVLYVGNYQLLIADACSGLNSIVALSAVGMLYTYLAGHKSWARNALLLASVFPVAFFANLVRVSGLVLITYYFGEDSGQRFHDHAAYLEIVVAFCMFFLIDRLLNIDFRKTPPPLNVSSPPVPPRASKA